MSVHKFLGVNIVIVNKIQIHKILNFLSLVGDLASDCGRIIRLFAGQTRFAHFQQYSVAFCSRLEAAIDVISGVLLRLVVPDQAAKFRVPGQKFSREIQSKAVGDGIFGRFFPAITAYRTQLVTSYPVRYRLGWYGFLCQFFGNSRSNRSRNIRAAHFVMNDADNQPTEAVVMAETLFGVLRIKCFYQGILILVMMRLLPESDQQCQSIGPK